MDWWNAITGYSPKSTNAPVAVPSVASENIQSTNANKKLNKVNLSRNNKNTSVPNVSVNTYLSNAVKGGKMRRRNATKKNKNRS